MKLTPELKTQIVQRLQDKGATKPCSRCGHPKFSLLDGFVNFPLAREVSNSVIVGGPNVPSAVVACENCGHLEFHALGAIGLLNEQKKGG